MNVIKELSVAQRMTLFLLGVVIFVSLFALTMWGTRPDFQPLYAGLSQQDAGEVVKKLSEKNIPYQIGPDGTSILVPAKQVREMRIQLATLGLPKSSGVGYELFDQFKLGTTEFTQKVNYQRALENELARTISGIDRIKAARVHIVMPDESVFVEDKEGASASLVLDVVGEQAPNGDLINGLVHLMATSVRGLSPKNVTIVDTRGNVLYAYSEEEGMQAGLTLTQVEVQRKYERMVQMRIEGMLNKVFGASTSVVRVNVLMNFDKLNTESETYLPSDVPLVRSEHSVEEGYKGNNSPPPANASVPVGQPNAQNSNFSKVDETRNYELSKRLEHYTRSAGAITKLSIAVILDRKLKDEERQNLLEAISSAAGVDSTRGDVLTLSTFPFDRTSLEQDKKEMKVMQRNQTVMTTGKNVVLVLLVLMAILYARTSLKKLSAISGSGGSWGVNVTAGRPKEVPRVVMPEDEVELSPEDQKRVAMKNSLVDMIHSDPEVFAKILRRWLSED